MATNESYVMTSHNLLNYSGMLFNKGNTRNPFSTMIGGKYKMSKSWTFPIALEYTTGGGSSQPAITETASLTAPNAEFVTRTQQKNYIQIFHRALAISYAKESSMGQMSGLNIAGQEPNPASELDFQVAASMAAIAADIEYSFLNGSYQDGTYDDVAYKTQGIIGAISTNAVTHTSKDLDFWAVAQAVQAIDAANQPTDNLVLMSNPVNIMQLNKSCKESGVTVIPAARDVAGIKVDTIITPFGPVGVYSNARIAAGTALIFNPDVCAPVYMDVPGKGNFFLEELAKTGAADKYQIYGQVGLDYGSEVCHAKITGMNTTFTAPDGVKTVKVQSSTTDPVHTKAVTSG